MSEEKVISQVETSLGIIQEVEKAEEIKINPFTAPNPGPSVDELCEQLQPILVNSEKMLQEMTKMYHISSELPNTLEAQRIVYEPNVTIASSDADAFNLNKPKRALKVEYGPKSTNSYVDRIFLSPDDVKFILDNKKERQRIFDNLILKMFENLVKTLNLKTDKLYYGFTIATISKPGEGLYARNYRDDYVELRMFSNVTDLEGEVENERSNSEVSS